MPIHYTVDRENSFCGLTVKESALDRFTDDIDLSDCDDCYEIIAAGESSGGSTGYAAALAYQKGYAAGYAAAAGRQGQQQS